MAGGPAGPAGRDFFLAQGADIFGNAEYEFKPHADDRAPGVITQNLQLSGGPGGKGKLTGSCAIEPFAMVTIVNGRTKKAFSAEVTAKRTLDLSFEAQPGDPLSISVKDAGGRETDVGIAIFGGQECFKPHERPTGC